ncbi:MAG: DUF61 family protein [Candidatus Hadarchaeales archaeon]
MNEELVKVELNRLNMHLPRNRISLMDALRSENPFVITKSGKIHSFDRKELEELAKLVDDKEAEKLMLPILIEINPSLGRGTARISGSLESKVISSILKREPANELLIYRPEIAELRRRFPTTTCYVFISGIT